MGYDNPEEYLEMLLGEIKYAQSIGSNGIYKTGEKITDIVADYAKRWLENNTNYQILFRKCPLCAFEWEIRIMF